MKTKLTLFVAVLAVALFGAGCANVGKAVRGTAEITRELALGVIGIPAKSESEKMWDSAAASGTITFSSIKRSPWVRENGLPDGGQSISSKLPTREGDGEYGYYFWRFTLAWDEATQKSKWKRVKGSWEDKEGKLKARVLPYRYLILTFGKPDRGYLGIGWSDDAFLNDVLKIDRVLAGSPAEKIGLMVDDVVVEVNGKEDVKKGLINRMKGNVGELIQIKVSRNGQKIDFESTFEGTPMPILMKWEWTRNLNLEKNFFYDTKETDTNQSSPKSN